MTVSELIRTKRAVRLFTDEPLSEEAIRSLYATGCLGSGHRLMHRFNVGAGKGQGDPGGSAGPSL
jgi:hypothetical protein